MRSFSPCGPGQSVVLKMMALVLPGLEARLGLGQLSPSREEMQAIALGRLDSITDRHANVGTWLSQR